MPEKERIDKIFSESNILTRSQTKQAAKQGRIAVNGVVVKDASQKAGEGDDITLDGNPVMRRKYFYLMLNQPAGYVCSTDDPSSPTVLELIDKKDLPAGLFPAGRLDKDTVGFVFLTNDGMLAHNLLSPKKHVEKVYFFRCKNPLSAEDIFNLENGVVINGVMTKKAKVEYTDRQGTITLTEGRYHQIKRMFICVGNEITYLRRITFGGISLDEGLSEGQYRHLTVEEVEILKNNVFFDK
jgi:16S rRNA pseudouridine516 synthase